jgi:ParB family transcriptional regulator, chromosome partitioning protein
MVDLAANKNEPDRVVAPRGSTSAPSLESDTACRRYVPEPRNGVIDYIAGPELVWANPNRCRAWDKHDNLDDAVGETIGLKQIASAAAHLQVVPVVGRNIINDPHYDFELICSSRRLFVARHLSAPLLVDVRNLTDRDAATLIDIDNRHAADVSAYERGLSYERWLHCGLFKTQQELSEAFKVSAAQVSRLIQLARVPRVILSAFTSPADVRETWAANLHAIWHDPRTRPAAAARARLLAARPVRLPASIVYEQLVRSGEPFRRMARGPASCGRDEVILAGDGARLFRIRHLRTAVAFVVPIAHVSSQSLSRIQALMSTVLQSDRLSGTRQVSP